MSDDELAEVPKGTLPVTQDMLSKKILTDPLDAMEMLRTNPVAVVGLSKVLREFANQELSSGERGHLEHFQKLLNQASQDLISITHLTDKYGMALIVELLTEIWRKKNQSTDLSSMNEFLLTNFGILDEDAQFLENTPNNRVIREMINYNLRRILDFESYEKMKSTESWSSISHSFEAYLVNLFSMDVSKSIPEEWHGWLYFCTASNIPLEILRNSTATIINNVLQQRFDSLPEGAKYQIAPFINLFHKMLQTDDE